MSDEERAFMAPYLMREDAPRQEYGLRALFNGLRWIIRPGAPWRRIPNDLPPCPAVYEQSGRWFKAGVFETMAHDLRAVLRLADGRHAQAGRDFTERRHPA